MSFDSLYYVPCLRWKQGEYQALYRLTPESKNSLLPLIEIPEIGFDFEKRKVSKTLDDHLSTFAKRVKLKWGRRKCLVDLSLIECSQDLANGQHPFAFVFNDLRSKGAIAIPVICLSHDIKCQREVQAVIDKDKRGLGIRVKIEEAAKDNLSDSLKRLLRRCKVDVEECDFLLDLEAPNFEPIEGFVGLLETLIRNLPSLEKWRSFTLISTSFPSSMAEVKHGLSIVLRNEWRLYKSLIGNLSASSIRIPAFGDYGINHPAVLQMDMRIVRPSASVRYTIDDGWMIVKGNNVRDHGFGQYRGMCKEIVKSRHYSGQIFSFGDKYIWDCAQGASSTGNLTTWRGVGTNHHLEKVLRDFANLFDP